MFNKRTKTKKTIKDSWGSIPIRIGLRQSKNGRIICYFLFEDQWPVLSRLIWLYKVLILRNNVNYIKTKQTIQNILFKKNSNFLMLTNCKDFKDIWYQTAELSRAAPFDYYYQV